MSRNKNRLVVPLFFQPEDSFFCGGACARMILRYFGKRYSLARLIRDIPVVNGVFAEDLGCWFLKNGFDVTIIGWPNFLPRRFISVADDSARGEIRRWCRRRVRTPNWLRFQRRNCLTRFLDAGGVYLPRPVTRCDLHAAVRRGEPPVLELESAVLYQTREKTMAHFVVVTGMGRGRVWLNDPYPGYGGKREYDLDRLLHASYISDSMAIFIRPKSA